ncbi:splicing factor [Tulasnella sp. 419]|nr:splicing factor [Tulasnella sp. 418]KAG8960306.1 splicing factor [Tulasnella sp. 419]
MGRLAEMQRRLLEQMMGPEAMGTVDANLTWDSEKVCRNYLCGTCPHALFTNTKMDLGPCPKLHTERLRNEFLAHKQKEPHDPRIQRFQIEYENNIIAFVEDCDRRIRVAHKRLEKTPEENAKTTNLMREIAEFELAIQGGTEKIEQLGEQGKVEESMQEMEAVEALKAEKTEKERELQQLTDTSGASGHQKLRVCDVCGAYLSVLDSDRRLADHFGGKMHLGYHELRQMLEGFREQRRNRGPPPPAAAPSFNSMVPPSAPRPTERDAGHRGTEHRSSRDDRGYDRDRRDRDGHRDRDRHGGHSSSRYEDRDRERKRDRERSRSPRRY